MDRVLFIYAMTWSHTFKAGLSVDTHFTVLGCNNFLVVFSFTFIMKTIASFSIVVFSISRACKVCPLSDELKATKDKVFNVRCFKLYVDIGYQLTNKCNNLSTCQKATYLHLTSLNL